MSSKVTGPKQLSRPSSCQACEHRTLRLFCNLGPDALRALDTLGMQITVPRGAILFREQDVCHQVTVLCDGQVKLSCDSRDGKTLILKLAMSGDVLGLSAALSGTRFEVTAEALQPSLIRTLRREDFLGFLEDYGEAGLHAARALSAEYRSAFFDAKRLALSTSVTARLASILLEWGRATACDKAEISFTMTLTHEELANFAGTTRESVTRALGKLQKDGLILQTGSTLHIPSPESLERFSH